MTRAAATLLALALLAGGCATPPAPAPAESPPPVAPPAPPPRIEGDRPRDAFERAQAERAAKAEARGHWAEALLAWEVLTLLRPQDPLPRERWAAAHRRAQAAVADPLARAGAAQRRGDLEAAAQAYLEALAIDPELPAAAEALRQIERERERRRLAARNARLNFAARRAADEPEGATSDDARRANALREHATLLLRQGAIDDAISLLRDNAATRSDTAARAMLADLYVQKAESLLATQPESARAAVDAALAIDRRHAGALALQRRLPKPPTTRSVNPNIR